MPEKINGGITQTKVNIGLLISAALWSTSGLLIKWLPFHPLAIASLRSILAALLILLYMRKKIRINKRTLIGGALSAMAMLLFVSANKLTTAANAIMLEYTSPVFALIITAVAARTKIKKRELFVVLMAMAGISLFFMEKLGPGGMAGNILALLSGVCYAGVYYFSSAYGEEAMHAMLLGHFFTFLIGLPFCFTQTMSFTLMNTGAILFLGIFQIGIPSILFSSIMKYTTPVYGAILTMLEPVLNPVWVFLGTGEIPGTLAFVGGVIVILSIFLNIKLNQPKKDQDFLPY